MIKEKYKLVGALKNKQKLTGKLGNAIIYVDPNMQEKIIEPKKEKQVITPDNGFAGLSKVTINKISDEYVIPDGNIEIKENGVFDIMDKKNAIVNVPEKILGVKKINKNGFYQAQTDNLDGYSEIEVNVDTTGESPCKWQRPSDWYDLPKILSEAEPIEYEGATYYPRLGLQLMITNDEVTQISLGNMLSSVYINTLIVTSDGQQFTNSSFSINITFDKSKDKTTRYIIVYDSSPNTTNNFQLQTSHGPILEVVLGGTTTWNNMSVGSSSSTSSIYLRNIEMLDDTPQERLSASYLFYGVKTLEHVKLNAITGGSTTGTYVTFGYCYNLKEVELPNLTKFTSSVISGLTTLERIYLPNLEDTVATFAGCYNLKELIVPKLKTLNTSSFLQNTYALEKLSLPSIETGIPIFTQSYNLKEVELPNDFKISGWSFAYCYKLTKSTLLDILNKLADVTDDTENTYTMTFGTVNLSKLTEDEIAIGTNKGWVIS